MRAGRYSGIAATHRLEFRVENESLDRASGDLIEAHPLPGRYLLSFQLQGTELPNANGVPALASEDYTALDFRLTPQTASPDETRARVEFDLHRRAGGTSSVSFDICWRSGTFRSLRVEPFVVAGAKSPDAPELPPVVAESDTSAAPGEIHVVDSLRAAGVEVSLQPPVELPLAGAGADAFWSKAELATSLEGIGADRGPGLDEVWAVPLLIASQFEKPGVLGVAFERDEPNGRSRTAAVFYGEIPKHRKVGDDPVRQSREYLFTTVHELGHVLGLPHAWDPLGEASVSDRSLSALTFMTYPDQYRLGYNRFYRQFRYDFRPEERAHLHHAPWRDIWPGGSRGDAPDLAREADPRLTIELRSPRGGAISLGEPVHLEVKLRNRTDKRVKLPADVLEPEGGRLQVFVTDAASGQRSLFRPLTRLEFRSGYRFLGAMGRSGEGTPDVMYGVVDLTYGCDGFCFGQPGAYRVDVVASLSERDEVRSAPLEIDVSAPEARQKSLLAELLDPHIGRALVLGFDPESDLRERIERLARNELLPAAAAVASLRLGETLSRPFKRVKNRIATRTEAIPERAAAWLAKAESLHAQCAVLPNAVRSELMALRARCRARAGKVEQALQTVEELDAFLESVVDRNSRLRRRLRDRIKALRRSIEGGSDDD